MSIKIILFSDHLFIPQPLVFNVAGREEIFVGRIRETNRFPMDKVHGPGVGARPGILAGVSGALTEKGINIKSVVTSQTCISLLLDGKDTDRGYHAIQGLSPRLFRRLEKIEDVSLVGIVGRASSVARALPRDVSRRSQTRASTSK